MPDLPGAHVGGVIVHFDGACEPARGGGIATWAFVVEGEGLDHEEAGLAAPANSPTSTNNVAEYTAAIRALEYLLGRGYRGTVTLIGDSQLVLRQLEGTYAVKKAHLRPLWERLRTLARSFEHLEPLWVPRESNARADELSKRAIYALSGPRSSQ